ncbi:MAG: OmpA family protein [Bacteroidota bacterium]
MNKSFRTLLLATFFLVACMLQGVAQTSNKPWFLGLSYTFVDYQGPVSGEYFQFNTMDRGGTISAHAYVNNFLNISFNTLFAPTVNYPVTEESFLETSMIDANAVATFKSNGTIFEESSFFAPYVSVGFGLNSASNIARFYIPASLGIRLQITEGFGVNFESTYKQSLKSTDFQHMTFSGGIAFTLPTPEKKTPKNPEPKNEPEENMDSDGDGVPDHRDRCPDEPGLQSYLGCPAVEPQIDETFTDTPDPVESEPSTNTPAYRPEPSALPTQAELDFLSQSLPSSIFFGVNSSNLLSESYPALDSLAAIMNRYPTMRLKVTGHTDDRGSYEINQVLSVMRAFEVKYYLVRQKGIKMRRITSDGVNSQDPIAPNDTEANRKKNRRVEFELLP